jgi:hypothetical protein
MREEPVICTRLVVVGNEMIAVRQAAAFKVGGGLNFTMRRRSWGSGKVAIAFGAEAAGVAGAAAAARGAAAGSVASAGHLRSFKCTQNVCPVVGHRTWAGGVPPLVRRKTTRSPDAHAGGYL